MRATANQRKCERERMVWLAEWCISAFQLHRKHQDYRLMQFIFIDEVCNLTYPSLVILATNTFSIVTLPEYFTKGGYANRMHSCHSLDTQLYTVQQRRRRRIFSIRHLCSGQMTILSVRSENEKLHDEKLNEVLINTFAGRCEFTLPFQTSSVQFKCNHCTLFYSAFIDIKQD